MQYKAFSALYGATDAEIAREVFLRHRSQMQIKKEKIAVQNLEKIFNAVFAISSRGGFHAMSMRDLSRAAGMSLGGLYAYFQGKKMLLEIIQTQGWAIVKQDLETVAQGHDHPWERLKAVIKAHVFLSEMHRPWFYFTFMEVRHIQPTDVEAVKAMETHTQKILTHVLKVGRDRGVFKPVDLELTASMIKAMQQEWYLKRWKYRELKISVDAFADHLVEMVAAYCLRDPGAVRKGPGKKLGAEPIKEMN